MFDWVLFHELGKTQKCTAQDQHFKIQILNLWMNWENLLPNLSFTVENKMGNLHKTKDGHILNLT